MIRLLIIFLFFVLTPPSLSAQTGVWGTLSMLQYDRNADGTINPEGKFIPMIQKLEGQEIALRGYMIPLSGKREQSNFMFSAYPYANCFFCGNAGPESIMEVFMKDDKAIQFSERIIELKGVFHFQPGNGEITYRMEEARLVK